MFRAFTITLPADTAIHNLFSLIVGTAAYGLANGGTNETGITGAIPTDGILTDRVNNLQITIGEVGGTIAISDRNNANSSGELYASGDVFAMTSSRNSICLKDYFLKGSAASQECTVAIEAI